MKKGIFLLVSCLLILWTGCSSDEETHEELLPPEISGLEEAYSLEMGEELLLSPKVVHGEEAVYSWVLDGTEVSKEPEYTFRSVEAKSFQLQFKVIAKGGTAEQSTRLVVLQAEAVILETPAYQVLSLDREELFSGQDKVEWQVITTASDLYRLSESGVLGASFMAARPGKYHLQAIHKGVAKDVMITVKEETKKLSPYFATVFDYLPAPGQFVNKLPEYEDGDTHTDMVRKAGEYLIGEEANMITLGGWGGYVVVGFDHTVVNVAGKRDFRINGNAFGANANGRPDAPTGGSCEPGIIQVAYDKNKNGKPDEDEWYEIKGSSNFTSESEPWYSIAAENGNDVRVFRDYSMTYYRPETEEADQHAEENNPLAYASIKNYIRWKDNQGNEGYKVKNIYHSQTYYPAWVADNELTFSGIRLPENAINEGKYNPGINEGGVYFVLYAFRYGYVDNSPNIDDNSCIDIDWAIDKNGNKVNLPGIDFIRIYNGVNQENGWLGECSTEVERGEDLHMLGKRIDTIQE